MPGILSPSAVALGVGGNSTTGGAGSALEQQTAAEIEEQKRKKRLGLSSASPALQQLMGEWPCEPVARLPR